MVLLQYGRSYFKHCDPQSTANSCAYCNGSSGTESEGLLSNGQLLHQKITLITLIRSPTTSHQQLVASPNIPQRNSHAAY